MVAVTVIATVVGFILVHHCCLADGRIWLQPSGSTLALREAIAFAVHFVV
jgi:hypothetical protein